MNPYLVGGVVLLWLLSSEKKTSPRSSAPKGTPKQNVLRWVPLMKDAKSHYPIVPLSLAAAFMENESGGNPNAHGPTNDAGLFQFIPSTARAYKLSLSPVDERLNPAKATFAAFHLISDLLQQWPGDERAAIASYNAGTGGVQSYRRRTGSKGVPNEAYVRHIQEKREKYRFLDQGA